MDANDLITFRALEELKYRYLRALDEKDWEAFRAVFEPDATADYGERLSFADRDEIVDYMATTLGPSMITLHQVHHPVFTVDGDDATGTWSLQDKVIMTDFRLLLEGSSTYEDRYHRGPDGVWRIAHTGYVRNFEYLISFDDVPSFNLMANRFA